MTPSKTDHFQYTRSPKKQAGDDNEAASTEHKGRHSDDSDYEPSSRQAPKKQQPTLLYPTKTLGPLSYINSSPQQRPQLGEFRNIFLQVFSQAKCDCSACSQGFLTSVCSSLSFRPVLYCCVLLVQDGATQVLSCFPRVCWRRALMM